MRQLERALLDLSERAEALPPEVLVSRVEARLTFEGLLPVEGETVQDLPQALKRPASPAVSMRLQRARSFAVAAVLTLVAFGITALVLRSDNAPIADEPTPPTTVSVAPAVPLSERQLTTVPEPSSPAAIAVAGTGDIWVGTGDGIWRISEEEATQMGPGDAADLTIAPDGTVWSASRSGIIAGLAAGENEFRLNHPGPLGRFGNIAVDREGTLFWAGNSGLHRLEGREWVTVDDAMPSALDDGVTNTLEVRVEAARDGTVWVGTWWGMVPESGGLARFNGTGWEEIALPADKPTPVYNLAVAPDGDLWVVLVEPVLGGASDLSLARFDGDAWTVLDAAAGMPQNLVYAMAVGSDGVVWLTQESLGPSAEVSRGVVAFDGEQWTSFVEDETVRDIAVEPDGTAWLAGDRLYRIDP